MKLCVALLLVAALCGCTAELPEPESEAAQLYELHCSGANCHGAIPPQRSTYRIWEMQYDRMIELMRKAGHTLPTPEEDRLILDYLRRYAEGGNAAE